MCVSTTHSNRDHQINQTNHSYQLKTLNGESAFFLQNTVTNVTTLMTSKLLITKVQKKLDVK